MNMLSYWEIIDLMKNDIDEDTATFLDTLTTHFFVPHIHPTRINQHSKTLIDNISSNIPNISQGKSGNLTLSISDHLAQFLIIPLDTGYLPNKINCSNVIQRNLIVKISFWI